MLTVFIIVFIVMLITVFIMAIGVIFGRAPIKGSCGGLNNVGVERACGCTDVCEQSDSPNTEKNATDNLSKGSDLPNLYRP